MNNPAHQHLNRHGAVHQPDAGVGGVAVGGGVGQGGAGWRLRAEQATEGEVVDEDVHRFADDNINFGKDYARTPKNCTFAASKSMRERGSK